MTGRARHVIASASCVLRVGLFLNFSIHQAQSNSHTSFQLHLLLMLCRFIKRPSHCSNGFHRFTTRSFAGTSATWSRSPADRRWKRHLTPRDPISSTNCDYHACFFEQRAAIQYSFGCFTIGLSATPTSATLTLCKYWLAASSWMAYFISDKRLLFSSFHSFL